VVTKFDSIEIKLNQILILNQGKSCDKLENVKFDSIEIKLNWVFNLNMRRSDDKLEIEIKLNQVLT